MTLPQGASGAPPVRELGPVEWTAVEAVTNGLRLAQQRCAQAEAELAALQRRRAAVLDALGLDAGANYHFEPDGAGGAGGARVYAASGGEDGDAPSSTASTAIAAGAIAGGDGDGAAG